MRGGKEKSPETWTHKTPFPKSEGEFWGSSFQGYPGGQAMWLNERARFSSAICRTTRKTTLAALLPQRVQYIPLRSQYTWVQKLMSTTIGTDFKGVSEERIGGKQRKAPISPRNTSIAMAGLELDGPISSPPRARWRGESKPQ
ncbi:hypothetical protein CCUS01_07543 [Colletotrichum cuscutae]|uniref:Uncharacterized protein n=1 Tax=Colletotrichum cuscutae TaxID=1209917 RepID=A0AAI9XZ37_9PEZI|nr:hypothetical protein CCUS01_07543 [Colletotrichum cuscutae]